MDISEKKEKFLLSAKKLINKISVSVTGSEIFNVPDLSSTPKGPPMDEGLLYVKTELLKRLNFNMVVPEGNVADSTGLHKGQTTFHASVKKFNDGILPIRERIIASSTKDELLKGLQDASLLASETYTQMHYSNKRFGQHPIIINFTNKYFEISANNPLQLIDGLQQAYKDKKAAGVNNDLKNLTNDPTALATVGQPLHTKPGFAEIQQKTNELGERFGVSFFEFPLENQTSKRRLHLLDVFSKQGEDFARRMGVDETCVGMQDNLGYSFYQSHTAGGWSNPVLKKITINNGQSDSSILAHEWTHSLDAIVMADAKLRLKEDYKGFAESSKIDDFYHISSLETSIIEDHTKELQRASLMKKFVNDAVSGNLEMQKRHQEELMGDEVSGVMFAALGDLYFKLPEDKKNALKSPHMVDAVRHKMLDPKNADFSENLKQNILWYVSHEPGLDRKRLDDCLDPEKSNRIPAFAFGRQTISDIERYKSTGASEIVLSSEEADRKINEGIGLLARAARGNERKGNKAGEGASQAASGNYYKNNVEVVARYVESQLFPGSRKSWNVDSLKGSEVYMTKDDPNFDKNRRALLGSVFGASSVKDMNVSDENVTILERIDRAGNSFFGPVAARTVETFDVLMKSAGELHQKVKDLSQDIFKKPENKTPEQTSVGETEKTNISFNSDLNARRQSEKEEVSVKSTVKPR